MLIKIGIKFNNGYKEIDIEENQIENCLKSDFFTVINDGFEYIINTKNINYIIYHREDKETWI